MNKSFILTEQNFNDSNIFNDNDNINTYIHSYLNDFLSKKYQEIKNLVTRANCFDHGMEKIALGDVYTGSPPENCRGETIGDWFSSVKFTHSIKI